MDSHVNVGNDKNMASRQNDANERPTSEQITGGTLEGTNHWTLIYSHLAPESMRNKKEKNTHHPSTPPLTSGKAPESQNKRGLIFTSDVSTNPPRAHSENMGGEGEPRESEKLST